MSFESVKIDDRWASLLESDWTRALDGSLFLKRCREGSVTKRELDTFAIQHFHYSRHFTRYLCALLSNMAQDGDRLELAENLFEELGFGDVGEAPHSQIYRDMLTAMGLDPTKQAPFPATRELVQAMFFYCRSSEPIDGLGAICLGAEAIVPHIYSQIIYGFRRHGFSDRDLDFFHLHVAHDDDHALTMKKIIEREISSNPSQEIRLRMAASDLIEKRRRFFDQISLACDMNVFESHKVDERVSYAI